MDRSNSLPWLIAGVLFVIVLVVSYLWISTSRDLQRVLAENRQEITSQRDQIMEKCVGANADRDACDRALTQLSAILQEFSAELSIATTSPQ